MKFEHYDYFNKVPQNKIVDMLNIIVPFYNEFNGKDNSKKEVYYPWINIIRNTKDYNVLLLYNKNTLIGFINFMYQNDGLMLSEVQILKKYQNKGILKKLISEVLSVSKSRNYDYIFGTINPRNEKSINVLTHIGFEKQNEILYKISLGKLKNWVKNN